MGEAGIESFQEPVERKDLFPAFLSFQRESLVLGHKSFDWMNATLLVLFSNKSNVGPSVASR
jgi:hypothetical protein